MHWVHHFGELSLDNDISSKGGNRLNNYVT